MIATFIYHSNEEKLIGFSTYGGDETPRITIPHYLQRGKINNYILKK